MKVAETSNLITPGACTSTECAELAASKYIRVDWPSDSSNMHHASGLFSAAAMQSADVKWIVFDSFLGSERMQFTNNCTCLFV
jgi:hypothetical protein